MMSSNMDDYQDLDRSELISHIVTLKNQLKQKKNEKDDWKFKYEDEVRRYNHELGAKWIRTRIIKQYEKQISLLNLTIYYKLQDLTNYLKIKFVQYYALFKNKMISLTN